MFMQVSPRERELLPLIPVVLCAQLEGAPTPAKVVTVLEAVLALGVPQTVVEELADKLIREHPTSRDLKLIFVLRDALKSGREFERVSARAILRWCARVCEVDGTGHDGTLSERSSAMVHMLAKALGGEEYEALVHHVGKEVVPVAALTGRQVEAAMLQVFAPDSETSTNGPEEKQAKTKERVAGYGSLMGSLTKHLPVPMDLVPDSARTWDQGGERMDLAGRAIQRLLKRESPFSDERHAKRLLEGLASSISLELKEKRRILQKLGRLNRRQIDSLIEILENEISQFLKLDGKHHRTLQNLTLQYGLDWLRLMQDAGLWEPRS